MATKMQSTPEERAAKRVKDRTDLMWHVATYVIINAFLWVIVPQAAFWVTIGWGIGLAFHIAAYLIEVRGARDRKYDEFLRKELEREAERSTS